MKTTIRNLLMLPLSTTTAVRDFMTASKSLLGIATVALGLAIPTQAQNAFTNGLVAYYPFSGNANDVWGGQNGEPIGNVTLTANRFGQAAMACNFDGTAFVNVPDATALHLRSLTISLWVQFNTTDGVVDILNKDDFFRGFQLYTGDNRVIFSIGDGDWHSTAGNGLITANEWHHIAATYDQKTISLFVDGINTDSVDYATTIRYSTNSLNIARNGAVLSQYLSGDLSNLRLYGRALSPDEIQQLYSYEASRLPQISLAFLLKTVTPAFSELMVGANYQLQVSGDLNTWTNQDSAFTATDTSMVYPQYFDVDKQKQLFFRLSQP